MVCGGRPAGGAGRRGGEGHPWATPRDARGAPGGPSRRACAAAPGVLPRRSSPRVSARRAAPRVRPRLRLVHSAACHKPVSPLSSNNCCIYVSISHPSARAQRVCSGGDVCRRGPPPARRCVVLSRHAPHGQLIKIDAAALSRRLSGCGGAGPVQTSRNRGWTGGEGGEAVA